MRTKARRAFLCLIISSVCFPCAQFLFQASYGQQLSPTLIRMSGYDVSYNESSRSPYDIGVGYMLSFKDMLVMPVMLEANPASLSNLYDSDAVSNLINNPLELHLKPGIKIDEHELYGLVGFQLGQFQQELESEEHRFELSVRPNFYGFGYSKALSEYMDYTAEVKLYYYSEQLYALSPTGADLDDSLQITDSACRLGLRLRV